MPQTFRMRFALGLWIVGCVFIIAHIQTNFFVMLTKPTYQPEIKNQKELLATKLNKTIGKT